MNAINTQKIGTAGKSLTEKKSLPGINTFSPPTALPRLCIRKSSYDTEGKDCTNISKIPRPPMTASYSFNETLKSNQSNGKTKKAPSMIPRSKSRKRNDYGKIRIDVPPSRAESPKKFVSKTPGSGNNEMRESQPEGEYELFTTPGEHESKIPKQGLGISPLGLKSCRDVFKEKSGSPDASALGGREGISSSRIPRKEGEVVGRPAKENSQTAGETEEGESRTIRHLYDTIKGTVGPLFENLKWTSPDKRNESEISCSASTKTEFVDGSEYVTESSGIQEHYDFTLKEILNVWKSSLSLLGSVKTHAKKYVEEKDKLVDKEQLSLEAEMLQTALDFAVSYSKLKTEFLIMLVKERLNLGDLSPSKLENLMDSKNFATLYNIEDLSIMAQNLHDLSASLVRGEDIELE